MSSVAELTIRVDLKEMYMSCMEEAMNGFGYSSRFVICPVEDVGPAVGVVVAVGMDCVPVYVGVPVFVTVRVNVGVTLGVAVYVYVGV